MLSGERGEVPQSELDAIVAGSGATVIAIAARNELEILQLPEADREVFLAEYGITEFRGDSVIGAAYEAAGLISFFTAGDKEVRAWTIPAGTAAPQAAGAIHTDFERGFIRAEVIPYEDLIRCGSIAQGRKEGVLRSEGKRYTVRDGDVINFLINV